MQERKYLVHPTLYPCPICKATLKVVECNSVPIAYHCVGGDGHHFLASWRLAEDAIVEIAVAESNESFELGKVKPQLL